MNVTLEEIKARTEEEGDCWIWQKGLSNGQPQMKVQGCDCKLVRRIVLQLAGRPAAPGQPVMVTCENPLCVVPKHLKPSTTGEIARQKAARGAWRGIARAAKISATKRASGQAKVSDAEVQALRTSTESGPAAAARLGVHRSLVSQIRRGLARKDYGNPFIGLMGAAR